MNKVFDEGLIGATKDMPVVRPSDVYNPEHVLSTVKKVSPRQIESKAERYVFKSPEYPDEPFDPSIDLDTGLHEYPMEYGRDTYVNLLSGMRNKVLNDGTNLLREYPSKLIKPV